MNSNKSGLHRYFRPHLAKPHRLFHQQQEKESGTCDIALYLMNNRDHPNQYGNWYQRSFHILKHEQKRYLYAGIHTPVCASACLMPSSSLSISEKPQNIFLMDRICINTPTMPGSLLGKRGPEIKHFVSNPIRICAVGSCDLFL